jgi:hypothetical protein
MEVLISVFVLSIGLLGLAALLPVGSYTILETVKADRAGDCGRAALRDVKVRRMLDPNSWTNTGNLGSGPSFVIDPLGVANGATGALAGYVPRISLNMAQAAQNVFMWPDDLIVTLPELMSPAQPFGRSRLVFNSNDPITGGNTPSFSGDYSWFLSVTRTFDPTRFRTSAVICYKRDFGPPNSGTPVERAVQVSQFYDQASMGGQNVALGGGSIYLGANHPINDAAGTVRVRENDWVALYSSSNGLCSWYRVIAVSPDSTYLTLNGPDWQVTGQDYLIAIGQSVLGVYTTTVELDQDPTWQQ